MTGAWLGSHIYLEGAAHGPRRAQTVKGARRPRVRSPREPSLAHELSPSGGHRALGAGAHCRARRCGRAHTAGPEGGGSTAAGPESGGACAAGGPGAGPLQRGVFSSLRSDVIGGSGWEPGGGGGGGAGRPPQVHVHVMKRHLTVGQDAREGARAGRTAAPPEPIAVAGLSMGEQEEGAVSAPGPAAAAPR